MMSCLSKLLSGPPHDRSEESVSSAESVWAMHEHAPALRAAVFVCAKELPTYDDHLFYQNKLIALQLPAFIVTSAPIDDAWR